MSTFAIVQAAIIALVVLASAVVAFRKLLPKTATRMQARLAATLNQPSRPHWMRTSVAQLATGDRDRQLWRRLRKLWQLRSRTAGRRAAIAFQTAPAEVAHWR